MADSVTLNTTKPTVVINTDRPEVTVNQSRSEVTIAKDINQVSVDSQAPVVTVETSRTEVTLEGQRYSGSGGGGSGDVFVLDVTCTGIIADKVYIAGTVPADVVLDSCTTDTDAVTVFFMCEGAGTNYSPTVTVDGVVCTNLAQYSGDRRNFQGSVDINVTESKVVTLISSAGQSTTVNITRSGAGPEVLTCLIGTYPGSQTAAKAGDTLNISGSTEAEATEVRLVAAGGFIASSWQAVTAGSFSFSGTVNSASGSQTCTVEARNSIGTLGTQFDSSNNITLDQLSPVIGARVCGYPSGQTAFKNSEVGNVTTTVSDFTSISYVDNHGDFIIANPTSYENIKSITCTNPGDYNDSIVNFQITANKSSNDTQTVATTIIEVADTNPVVTVSQPHARLRSAPLGEDHTITATSDQNFDGTSLDIDAPVGGAWQGSWVGSGKIWTRTLRVLDTDDKGSGLFSFNSVPVNNAGLQASITGTQVNGGFVPRDLVLQAFNNEISVAVAVVDYTKVQMGLWEFTGASLDRSATINDTPPVPGYFSIDQQGLAPHTFLNLDTNQTNASSQATMIYDYEEVV